MGGADAVENAIKQYKKTRLPKDPATNKPEPLLTFKRGALVHFAVSQYEAYMTTKLEGEATHFLPFNRGTEGGGDLLFFLEKSDFFINRDKFLCRTGY